MNGSDPPSCFLPTGNCRYLIPLILKPWTINFCTVFPRDPSIRRDSSLPLAPVGWILGFQLLSKLFLQSSELSLPVPCSYGFQKNYLQGNPIPGSLLVLHPILEHVTSTSNLAAQVTLVSASPTQLELRNNMYFPCPTPFLPHAGDGVMCTHTWMDDHGIPPNIPEQCRK